MGTMRWRYKDSDGFLIWQSLIRGKVVLKQIHHEPCDYYQFGNKIEAELNDYKHLRKDRNRSAGAAGCGYRK